MKLPENDTEMSTRMAPPRTAAEPAPEAAPPKPRRPPRASVEAVVAHLKIQIKIAAVGPGHRLVESDIMAATGASRAHVRDAFKQMAAEGFVQIEEFKGASIRRLTRQEVVEMYGLRGLLESYAIGIAARSKWTVADKARLRALQSAMDKAEASLLHDRFRQLNDDYHLFIRQASGNGLLHEHLERLRLPLLLAQFHRFFDVAELKAANADHRVMTTALLAGDPAKAEKVMRRHVAGGLKTIMALDDHHFA